MTDAKLDPAGTQHALDPASSPQSLAEHSSRDSILSHLSAAGGLIADLVNAFPGAQFVAQAPRWLDDWFQRRTETVFHGAQLPRLSEQPPEISAAELAPRASGTLTVNRLVSIEPRYFRGFRTLGEPIVLAAGLVVVEGRNSSGKTSLAEALEWLFTGSLARRELRGQGNPRELEACIGNHFRPDTEETWVEAVFELVGGSRVTLRRVLVQDYATTLGSRCASCLLRDGVELSPPDAETAVENLFNGCPPLLMQHTLHLFVHGAPTERRAYFERLLQLDEITELIEKAVIGNKHIADFPSPTGSAALRRWDTFKKDLTTPAARAQARQVDRSPAHAVPETLRNALAAIAHEELQVGRPGLQYTEIRDLIAAEQRKARQRSFPLLSKLRPRRILDDSLSQVFNPATYSDRVRAVETAMERLRLAQQSASDISEAQFAVARAVAQLTQAGLIPEVTDIDVECPVCEFPEAPTLRAGRLGVIRTWEPARLAVQNASRGVSSAAALLATAFRELVEALQHTAPESPADPEWDEALVGADSAIVQATTVYRDAIRSEQALLSRVKTAASNAQQLCSIDNPTAAILPPIREHLSDIESFLPDLSGAIQRCAAALKVFENAVGVRTSADANYARRDDWLAMEAAADDLGHDVAWERAKATVQSALEHTREVLIGVRQEVLDSRRVSFSQEMSQIWNMLRSDRYSSFDQLVIPEPSGKGYPIQIEVKARLDDGTRSEEVDALRVFSESQVNALGIAAFVTRANLLGQRVLVFDDPVQSMDEEHFKTFATKLLPYVLDNGVQVIVLTHNDTFARDIGFAHADRNDYATVKIVHSRRKGCRIDQDNRRVRERLARARRVGEDGDLEEAWKTLRLAIERLYVLVRTKYGEPGFNPGSWVDQTAEYMYNEGVGEILTRLAPGLAEGLHDILGMTAAGAHDKASRGLTDLLNSAETIEQARKVLSIVD